MSTHSERMNKVHYSMQAINDLNTKMQIVQGSLENWKVLNELFSEESLTLHGIDLTERQRKHRRTTEQYFYLHLMQMKKENDELIQALLNLNHILTQEVAIIQQMRQNSATGR